LVLSPQVPTKRNALLQAVAARDSEQVYTHAQHVLHMALLELAGLQAAPRPCIPAAVALTCVHVLNPEGINGAIKEQPLLVWTGVLRKIAHVASQHAICPLVGVLIKLAIQLTHGDGLGIQHSSTDLEVSQQAAGAHA
jgi:hypothetical protein